jgi:putative PIN family toxin of toxin-antitoxin system
MAMAIYGCRNRRIMWPSPSAIQAARTSPKSATILSEPTPPIPLLVLDTNVVLDWVAFRDPRVQPIAAAIERGTLRTATSGACLQELRRALSYAQVKLDAAAQALAFERYAAHVKVFDIPEPAAAMGLPRCEDVDDQKFLEVAWHVRASHLVTRDKALLKLARRLVQSHRFTVLAPDAFLRWAHGLLRR